MIDQHQYRIHLTYFAIILAIITGVFFYGKHEGVKKARLENENEFLKGRIKELETIVDTTTIRIKEVRTERAEEVKKSEASKNAYKAEIRRLRKSLSPQLLTFDTANAPILLGKLDPSTTISVESDSIVAIGTANGLYWEGSFSQFDDFITDCLTKDTLLQVQDSLIFSLESQQSRLTDSYEKEIALMQSKYDAQAAISDTWRKGYESSQKEIKKQSRGKKVWRSLAVILGISTAGLLIGSQ